MDYHVPVVDINSEQIQENYNLKEKLREQRSVEESKKIRILYYI
jgi:hypothetical protein